MLNLPFLFLELTNVSSFVKFLILVNSLLGIQENVEFGNVYNLKIVVIASNLDTFLRMP